MDYNKKNCVKMFLVFLFATFIFIMSCTNEDLEEWGIFPQDALRIEKIEPCFFTVIDTIEGTESFSTVKVKFWVKSGELQHQYRLNLYKYEILYFYEDGDTVVFINKSNPNSTIQKLSFSINCDVKANDEIELLNVPFYPGYLKNYRPDRDKDNLNLNRVNLEGEIIIYGKERLTGRIFKGSGNFTVILYSK